jgi:hypothetical protein
MFGRYEIHFVDSEIYPFINNTFLFWCLMSLDEGKILQDWTMGIDYYHN